MSTDASDKRLKKKKKKVKAVLLASSAANQVPENNNLERKSIAADGDGLNGLPHQAIEATHQANSSYKKKFKKAASREAAAAAAAAAANGYPSLNQVSAQAIARNSAGHDQAARKASRKSPKATTSTHAADVNGASVTSVAQPDTPVKKKKRKRVVSADAEHQADSIGLAIDEKQPSSRKVQSSGQPMSNKRSNRALASVGDVTLARNSKAIVRSTYTEHAATATQTEAAVAKLRDSRATTVTGTDWKPIREFAHSGFGPELLQSCAEFTHPSPIQSECWAPASSGEDVVGIAATGSGKTLAFGLPALAHVRAQLSAGVADGRTPSALVIAPTRELAVQISEVLEDAGKPIGLTTLCVYGGVPKQPQAKKLRAGVNVLVATPGRLEDLMDDNAARLHQVTFLVLDEADRMLDLGFEPHIRAIANKTRADRQTLMFSATWPPAIQRLASEFLSNPVKVTIGSPDLSASHSVSQVVEVIDPRARDKRLQQLLRQYHDPKRTNRIIVFVLYKKEAARVEAMLTRAGWKAVAVHGDASQATRTAVHGDASQATRTAAVDSFKAGTVGLLIATDVAARGLDIPDVEVVINYSFPLTVEDYVHRIGRTGRAGKTGSAHTFFSGETDKPRAGELINVLREAGQPVPEALLAFGTTVKKKESKLYGAHFKDVDFSKKATKKTFDDSDGE